MSRNEWVPFHESLCAGDKRGLPRATRFIFMQIVLESRRTDGVLVLPRGFKTDAHALQDVLGGDLAELSAAIKELTTPIDPSDPEARPMLLLEGAHATRRLTVVSFSKYAEKPTSTERVRRHRNAKVERGETVSRNAGNDSETRYETPTGQDRTGQDRTGSETPPCETPIVIPDAYVTAFTRGVTKGSAHPRSRPTSAKDIETIVAIVDAHAKDPRGERLVETAQICAWLESAAERFGRDADAFTRTTGLRVSGFESFLNAGPPRESNARVSTASIPDAPDPALYFGPSSQPASSPEDAARGAAATLAALEGRS